jgi:hypothetical protein
MNISKLMCLTILISCGIPIQGVWCATIPAGTTLLVKTSTTIHSRDVAGRKFQGQLAKDVGANGKVLVPAGTSVTGVVKSSWFTVGSTTRPLTLRLTEIVIHGRAVPIKTDDFEAKNSSPWTTARRGIQVTGGNFLLQHGTILQFHLAQPVNI